jgi:glycosyltransferase involved in cell wall biosynthesis
MRYIWDTAGAYFEGRRRDMRYTLLNAFSKRFRRWDVEAASRVGEYISISGAVQERVKRCYGRDSDVIHPPVDTEFYRPAGQMRGDFYLWAGALAPYKRIDVVLGAFAKLGRKLVVIGDGQDLRWAMRHAPGNVSFLGRQPDKVLREHYSTCRALVFAGEEDFGIVPAEAQACGCPVIAYGKGGVLDTVVPLGRSSGAAPTGVFFNEPSVEGLMDAMRRFEAGESMFDPAAIRAHALQFSRERCKEALRKRLLGVQERAK